jgi:phage tail sheath protein FI
VAVLDSADGQTIAAVRALRARLDSSHAALYYPWITVQDPVTAEPLQLPPRPSSPASAHASDAERGVHKAPANELARSAIGFEVRLRKSEQDVLNPKASTAFAPSPAGLSPLGRAYREFRPRWKYLHLRRYFAYLEHSIDKGNAVDGVRAPRRTALGQRAARDRGLPAQRVAERALLGDRPDKAFFVRCDRTTMTQNDLDNGRLVCLVGVAPLKPAEFVIFRIGQWTADRED